MDKNQDKPQGDKRDSKQNNAKDNGPDGARKRKTGGAASDGGAGSSSPGAGATETSPTDAANTIEANMERNVVTLFHLSGALIMTFIPVVNFVAPFLFWTWKRAEYPALDKVAADIFNFQISIVIYATVAVALGVFSSSTLLFLPAVMAFNVVVCVYNAMNAAQDKPTRYMYPFPFIR